MTSEGLRAEMPDWFTDFLWGPREKSGKPTTVFLEPSEIREHYDKLLHNEDASAYFENLGLASAGFLFEDIPSDRYNFFSGDPDAHRSYLVPYLVEGVARESKAQAAAWLHTLFVHVRESQLEEQDENSEYLPDHIAWLDTEPRPWKACRIGEIFFWCYLWRLMLQATETSTSASLELRACKVELHWAQSGKSVSDVWLSKQHENSAGIIGWNFVKEPVPHQFQSIHESSWIEALNAIHLPKSGAVIASEFRKLNLPVNESGILQRDSPESWEQALRNPARTFLEKYCAGFTRDETLLWIERNAPFPILPFYVWNAVDRSPKTYFVSLIWQSPSQPVRKNRAARHAVGFALCATRPFDSIEHQLPDSWAKAEYSPAEISSLLGDLSSPLVDANFYAPISKQLMKLREREVMATVMARNLSHNIGSHVLTHPRLPRALEEVGGAPDDNLRQLMSYLQSRLDFIAQALSDVPTPPQPLFLIADFLVPFLEQAVLIDLLTCDRGFRASKIRFVCKLHEDDIRSETITFSWDDEGKGNFRSDKTRVAHDVLIAFPGGALGSHALAIILENILRNAAVHTSKDDKELTVFITLTKGDNTNSYDLAMTTDRSDATEEQVSDIKAKLKTGPIKPTGERIHGGHGLWEMRYCARFLSGNQDGLRAAHEALPGRPDFVPPEYVVYSLELHAPRLLRVFPSEGEKNRDQGMATFAIASGDASTTLWEGEDLNLRFFRAGSLCSRQRSGVFDIDDYLSWMRAWLPIERWKLILVLEDDIAPDFDLPESTQGFIEVRIFHKNGNPNFELEVSLGAHEGLICLEHHSRKSTWDSLPEGKFVRYACIDDRSFLRSVLVPPRDQDSQAFLLLSMIESFAMRIGIADERIAQSISDEYTLRRYHLSGIFPFFKLGERALVDDHHFTNQTNQRDCSIDLDAVVIHESLGASFQELADFFPNARMHVRTSGGGGLKESSSYTRQGGQIYPFIPFSVLNMSTVSAKEPPANKAVLAQALLSLPAKGLAPFPTGVDCAGG
ncbi:MAG: hypothetical protein AAF662_00045 [Pseudomonadota bacterium]